MWQQEPMAIACRPCLTLRMPQMLPLLLQIAGMMLSTELQIYYDHE